MITRTALLLILSQLLIPFGGQAQTVTSVEKPPATANINQPISYDGPQPADGVQTRYRSRDDFRSALQSFVWPGDEKLTGIGLMIGKDQNADGGTPFVTTQEYALDVLQLKTSNVVEKTVDTALFLLEPSQVLPGQYLFIQFAQPLNLQKDVRYAINLRPVRMSSANRLLIASTGRRDAGGQGDVSNQFPGVGGARQSSQIETIADGEKFSVANDIDLTFFTTSDSVRTAVNDRIVSRVVYGPPQSYMTYPHSNGFWRPENGGWGKSTAVLAIPQGKSVSLRLFDPESERTESLVTVENMRLYYSIAENGIMLAITHDNQAVKVDLNQRRTDVIYRPPEGWRLSDIADISRNGSKGAVTLMRGSDPLSQVEIIDLTGSGASQTVVKTSGKANHAHFSPFDETWVTYCHEGDASIITDRIRAWHPVKAPEGELLFQQLKAKEPNLEVGHERAMFHTPGTLFCVYKGRQDMPPGLYEASFDRTYRLISKGDAWHCNISRDGKWAVIDTQGADGASQIFAVNYATGARELLAAATYTQHPYHPHPQISPDGHWVIFNDAAQQRAVAIEINQEKLRAFAP